VAAVAVRRGWECHPLAGDSREGLAPRADAAAAPNRQPSVVAGHAPKAGVRVLQLAGRVWSCSPAHRAWVLQGPRTAGQERSFRGAVPGADSRWRVPLPASLCWRQLAFGLFRPCTGRTGTCQCFMACKRSGVRIPIAPPGHAHISNAVPVTGAAPEGRLRGSSAASVIAVGSLTCGGAEDGPALSVMSPLMMCMRSRGGAPQASRLVAGSEHSKEDRWPKSAPARRRCPWPWAAARSSTRSGG
jgi:hypothetical protein